MAASAFRYTPINPYRLLLRAWDPEIDSFTLIPCLAPLGTAIHKCTLVIERAASSASDDYADAVADEETEKIEALLGAAFILCQIHITSVVSRVITVRCFFNNREKRALPGPDASDKRSILIQGAQPIHDSGYTDVQAIDAFANYFKHRDEWAPTWQGLTNIQEKTREIVYALGARPGSSGNLRTGAQVLGNSEYHTLIIFADRLALWNNELRITYEAKLNEEHVL